MLFFTYNAWAGNFYHELTSKNQAYQADTQTRMELLSIFEMCGSPNNINEACILNNLQDNSVKITNPALAQQIINDYHAILVLNTHKPECVNRELLATNHALAHCYLSMNFYILSEMDREVTQTGLHQCLNRRLGAMASRNNVIAQYRLHKLPIYSKGSSDDDSWHPTTRYKHDKRVYGYLSECYD